MRAVLLSERLKILLHGRFRVLAPDGKDLTPSSKKGRAVLAMLALSPGNERSRPWLQEKLWSQQDPWLRAASLRQCLSVLRKTLGVHKDCLTVEKQSISLSAEAVFDGSGEFLEDLNIPDPEFKTWRADQSLLEKNPKRTKESASPGFAKPRVVSRLDDSNDDARFFSALVSDAVIGRLSEAGSIETVETDGDVSDTGSNPGRLEFVLRTYAMKRGDHSGLRIRLEAAESGAVIWTGHKVLQSDSLDELNAVEVRRLMNFAVDAAVDRYSQLRPSNSVESQSSALCFRAVSKMFTLESDELREAEGMLNMAGDLDDRGIYFAWRAYLKIIQFGERLVTDRAAMAEEAQQLIAHALERGADNSMVLALASYVQSVIFKNYAAGAELAEQSLNLSQINPLAWTFLGISKMHLGDLEGAHECTSYARNISGHGPQKYQLNMLACQTAMVTGRFDEAIKLAELTMALAPNYAPPKRYLAALLLNADREQDANRVLADLKRLEPDFSLDQMTDPAYPASALRLSPLGKRLSSLSQRLA